jgi:hypothetical protein
MPALFKFKRRRFFLQIPKGWVSKPQNLMKRWYVKQTQFVILDEIEVHTLKDRRVDFKVMR